MEEEQGDAPSTKSPVAGVKNDFAVDRRHLEACRIEYDRRAGFRGVIFVLGPLNGRVLQY